MRENRSDLATAVHIGPLGPLHVRGRCGRIMKVQKTTPQNETKSIQGSRKQSGALGQLKSPFKKWNYSHKTLRANVGRYDPAVPHLPKRMEKTKNLRSQKK